MDPFSEQATRGYAAARERYVRFRTGFGRPMNPFERVLWVVVALLMFGALLLLLIPLLILGVVGGLLLGVVFSVRRAFARAKAPNGPLDGRENVRVVRRD